MKKTIFFILLLILLVALYNKSNQEIIIPSNSIRLRVIPNSNNPQDIYIKEEVLSYLENNLINKNISNIDDLRSYINNNLSNIDKSIKDIFHSNNYHQLYNINYGNNYFPKKVYQGHTYQEGYYESLVVSIGSANGDNFWCCLFPNFCLIDKKEKPKSYIYELIHKIF